MREFQDEMRGHVGSNFCDVYAQIFGFDKWYFKTWVITYNKWEINIVHGHKTMTITIKDYLTNTIPSPVYIGIRLNLSFIEAVLKLYEKRRDPYLTKEVIS